jgi:hypothetical protein
MHQFLKLFIFIVANLTRTTMVRTLNLVPFLGHPIYSYSKTNQIHQFRKLFILQQLFDICLLLYVQS